MNENNSYYLTIIAVCIIVFATIFGGCREYEQTEREYIKAGFYKVPMKESHWEKAKQ